MTLIDANVILRYILNDIPDQTNEAGRVIYSGAFTLIEVISEVVYVLTKVYNYKHADTSNSIITVLAVVSITNKDIVLDALTLFGHSSFDFVDCVLIARKRILGENVFTFDKKLNNVLKKYN